MAPLDQGIKIVMSAGAKVFLENKNERVKSPTKNNRSLDSAAPKHTLISTTFLPLLREATKERSSQKTPGLAQHSSPSPLHSPSAATCPNPAGGAGEAGWGSGPRACSGRGHWGLGLPGAGTLAEELAKPGARTGARSGAPPQQPRGPGAPRRLLPGALPTAPAPRSAVWGDAAASSRRRGARPTC